MGRQRNEKEYSNGKRTEAEMEKEKRKEQRKDEREKESGERERAQ